MIVSQLETEVALFHDARRREKTDIARDEDRLRIAVTERFKLLQPSGQDRGDLMERQHGVDVKDSFGFARSEAFGGALGEATLEFGKGFCGQSEADGEGVTAKSGEQVGAGFNGREKRKPVDRAA
jgi:hypothetical protein